MCNQVFLLDLWLLNFFDLNLITKIRFPNFSRRYKRIEFIFEYYRYL